MSISGDPQSGKLEEAGMFAIINRGGSPLHGPSITVQLVVRRMEYDVPSPDGFKVLDDHRIGDEFLCLCPMSVRSLSR